MKYSLPYFDESAHLAADDSWHDAPFWFFHASLLTISVVVLFK